MLGALNLIGQSSEFRLPSIGDETHYSIITDYPKSVQFNDYKSVIWDYSQLRPTYIAKESFTECLADSCDLIWNQRKGEKRFYSIKEGSLKLTSMIKKVSFTQSEEMTFQVLGDATVIKEKLMTGKVFNSKYSLVGYLRSSDINEQLDFIPKGIDSIKIIISLEEKNKNRRTGTLSLYSLEQKAHLIESTIRSELEIHVKYTKTNDWYKFNYDIPNLPKDLIWYASRVPETLHSYYTDSYVMPVLHYNVRRKRVEEVYIQDRYNVFNVPVVEASRKKIIAYPNPASNSINFNLINFPTDNYRLEIYNILGDRVKVVNLSKHQENKRMLDISNLRNGIYLYRFVDGSGLKTVTQRFLKTSA